MNLKEYTVKPGRHGSRPFVSPLPRFSREPSGAWTIQLGTGWDYELTKNKLQWNKVCGHTFNPVRRNRNAIMLGIRRNGDKVEVSPYYNVHGQRWYKGANSEAPAEYMETWPVMEIHEGQKFTFYYRVQGKEVYAGIMAGNSKNFHEVGHKIIHPGIGCIRHEVNFWFGGSQPAPNRISIFKERVDVPNWLR